MTSLLRIASTLALLLGLAAPACAGARLPTGFVDELLESGLDVPVSMAFLPDGRLLVTEKNAARIRILVNGVATGTPVAVMDSVRLECGGSPCVEAGLLGIAVDPGWPARPYLYTAYNYVGGPWIRLVRLTATGDLDHTGDGQIVADPAGEYLILADLPDQNWIHNGGTLRFALDGTLFMSLGDDNSQCLVPVPSALVGKLLRIDVSNLPPGPGALVDYAVITPLDNPFVGDPDPRARLVWASGLRNPWNFHIDPPTGRIFVPDVGVSSFEELNLLDAPGLDFGWPWYEAYTRTSQTCLLEDSTGSVAPIHAYDRQAFFTFSAIMGAGVYRRPSPSAPHAFPAEYEGDYFFSDLGQGFLRRLRQSGANWSLVAPVPGQPSASDWARRLDNVTDYLVGPDGALWYVRSSVAYTPNSGEVHRILGPPESAAAAPPGPGPSFGLNRPYPSPSRGPVTLGLSLARPAFVRLAVHDLSGRAIRTLASGELPAGSGQSFVWDGRDAGGRPVPTGVYVASLTTPEGVASIRCLIVR